MHILLFNEYYPPDTSATAKMAARVAETLARRHKVTVVAGRPSYDPDEFYPFTFLRRDTRNGVVVERVGSTAYPRHQMIRRVSNYLTYLALAVPRAIALRPDIVLAMTDPPVAGIAGAFVARRLGRPIVYNIRDMYPDMAVGGDIVRPGVWVNRWEKMHRRALKQAARVIVLGDDMRDRILAKGGAPGLRFPLRCLNGMIQSCRNSDAASSSLSCTLEIWAFMAPGARCSRQPRFYATKIRAWCSSEVAQTVRR